MLVWSTLLSPSWQSCGDETLKQLDMDGDYPRSAFSLHLIFSYTCMFTSHILLLLFVLSRCEILTEPKELVKNATLYTSAQFCIYTFKVKRADLTSFFKNSFYIFFYSEAQRCKLTRVIKLTLCHTQCIPYYPYTYLRFSWDFDRRMFLCSCIFLDSKGSLQKSY